MAVDAITFNVAIFSATLGPELENSDAIIPIGASQLGDYFSLRLGDEIPARPEDRIAMRQTIEALGNFSMDWAGRLKDVFEKEPRAYLAAWNRSFEPVISKTRSLGKRVDAQLTSCLGGETPFTNDVTLLAGVFDISSFGIAMAAAIPHPRYAVAPLMDASRRVTEEGQTFATDAEDESLIFDLVLRLPIIRKEDRLRAKNLRQQGSRIIHDAELNLVRLRLLADRRLNDQN